MGTSNSCAITNEEKWEEYIEQTVLSRPVQSLLIPGTWLQGRPVWPRSHLNSSKPVSSIDLHTQVSLQSILPEAIYSVYKTESEGCSVDPTTNSETRRRMISTDHDVKKRKTKIVKIWLYLSKNGTRSCMWRDGQRLTFEIKTRRWQAGLLFHLFKNLALIEFSTPWVFADPAQIIVDHLFGLSRIGV